MYDDLIDFIKKTYPLKESIFLHEPVMGKKEEDFVLDCIRSGFVSSVGEYVEKAEEKIAEITGADYAVCVSTGTAALHTALTVAGVEPGDIVLTQSLSFIASANAIRYCGADPFFIDIDKKSLSLSCERLLRFLDDHTENVHGITVYKDTGQKITACVPMHTFGHIGEIDEICRICNQYNIKVIEDAAEAVGSFYKNRHAGTFGDLGILSFNGNKIVTSGGGGAIITNNRQTAAAAKHISTTARKQGTFFHEHDAVGFNYRMPNLNASFLYSQLMQLDEFINKKRALADHYKKICEKSDLEFFNEPENCRSNYWLNTIIFENSEHAGLFMEKANKNNIFPRMVWKPLHMLGLYKKFQHENLENTKNLYTRIVNLPSSVPDNI